MFSVIPFSAALGAMVLLAPRTEAPSDPCRSRTGAATMVCADLKRPLPAGDAPAFLFAAIQPIEAPEAWRAIYHEVEHCVAMGGDYDQIRWAVMEAPLQGPNGPTYGFNLGSRIVLIRQDTTYLRHEMLHHILQVAGWQPRRLQPGEQYTIADLHPMALFGLCTGGS